MSSSSSMKSEMLPMWTQNSTSITIEQDRSPNQVNSKSVSALVVEKVLKTAFFHQATGWMLEVPYRGEMTCSPTLTIWPVFSIPVQPLKFYAEPDCGCCKPCSSREKGWRTYSLQAVGSELIRFRYQPHICLGTGRPVKPICEIFIPQRAERIGWMKDEAQRGFRSWVHNHGLHYWLCLCNLRII